MSTTPAFPSSISRPRRDVLMIARFDPADPPGMIEWDVYPPPGMPQDLRFWVDVVMRHSAVWRQGWDTEEAEDTPPPSRPERSIPLRRRPRPLYIRVHRGGDQ